MWTTPFLDTMRLRSFSASEDSICSRCFPLNSFLIMSATVGGCCCCCCWMPWPSTTTVVGAGDFSAPLVAGAATPMELLTDSFFLSWCCWELRLRWKRLWLLLPTTAEPLSPERLRSDWESGGLLRN